MHHVTVRLGLDVNQSLTVLEAECSLAIELRDAVILLHRGAVLYCAPSIHIVIAILIGWM